MTLKIKYHTLSFLGALLLTLLAGCQERPQSSEFTVEALHWHTPIKTQGTVDAGWAYATLSLVETELARSGDTLELSVPYLMRLHYIREARRMTESKVNYRLGSRSLAHHATYHLRGKGAIPEALYPNKGYRKEMDFKRATEEIKAAMSNNLELEYFPILMDRVMDQYMPALPAEVEDTLQRYYVNFEAITSLSERPLGKRIILPLPENRIEARFLNLPLEKMVQQLDSVLESGRTALWFGDTKVTTYSQKEGIAELADSIVVSEERRQADFTAREMGYNHAMHIVGYGHRGKNERYYILKDSHGTAGAHNGYIYMSLPYLKMKTVAIYYPQGEIVKE